MEITLGHNKIDHYSIILYPSENVFINKFKGIKIDNSSYLFVPDISTLFSHEKLKTLFFKLSFLHYVFWIYSASFLLNDDEI